MLAPSIIAASTPPRIEDIAPNPASLENDAVRGGICNEKR